MEKQGSGSTSRELQCVGRLEIESPKPVGFLCGSIPITTDEAFHDFTSAALVPSSDTVRAPRYQMIPTETDLNSLPTLSSIPDKVLPVTPVELRSREEAPSQGGHITSSLTRKGEALAVSGLAEYGDEIDVIAPADILKQIFKIPYSKSRVSIAVRRVGQTLVLNTGPDIEEGEKLIRRQHRQPKCVDQSLFLNFAMHSVRMEACDCPPSHNSSTNEKYGSSIYSKQYMPNEVPLGSSNHRKQGHASFRADDDLCEDEGDVHDQGFPQDEKGKFVLGKKNKRNKGREAVKKVAEVKEKTRGPVQESEKYRKTGDDGFLRVLFWQFHNFRMLLGSDLLIFSNEKYVAVSLHLWDVSRKVTPLTWLEAWLDNYTANVPELAICYHQDGVVQGYELLKTDDIFLLKGISDDGTPAFYPHVVQQNGLSVMRFLQENCKQEPGAYWLYKSAGEDVIQLFDLSVIPKTHTADSCHDSSSSLPSLIYRGRSDSILALGTLLYRIAHRLSLSMSSDKRARCARLFQKCLTFLDEPDHLVVRALAHEQFARLLLTYNDELELTSDMLPVESEVKIADAEEESYEFISGMSASNVQDISYPPIMAVEEPNNLVCLETNQENSAEVSPEPSIPPPGMPIVSDREADENLSHSGDSEFAVHSSSESEDHAVQTVADPLASKLAAIHHVSQAIKSLRWTRQLQSTRPEVNHESETEDNQPPQMDFSICACGDSDCIEVCDIREWLPTSKLDDKLWKLVLLLGESYLALGEAYKESSQLYQALKVTELACLVYGSMPQDNKFISSMVGSSLAKVQVSDISEKAKPVLDGRYFKYDDLSSNYLFWAKAWTLVGDVFVEFYLISGQEVSKQEERKGFSKDLKMSSEVLKEVERLKKKMGQFNKNCSSCSLVNCSCRSDRASSGSSASCSTRDTRSSGHGRKQSKKSRGKSSMSSRATDLHKNAPDKGEHIGEYNKHLKHDFNNGNMTAGGIEEAATSCQRVDISLGKDNAGSKEESAVKRGGIFKYLRGSTTGDLDHTLCVALSCYGEVEKVMSGLPASSAELQSLVKKKGWVCNELGRNRLETKELGKAESAFVEAIVAFRQVEDHTNIILINCNLGHGRRALAEDMVSKIGNLKEHAIFQNAYVQALEAAKQRYSEALRYYGAAKTELNTLAEKSGPVPSALKNEVNTQFAHTYLKLGMLLARENTVAEVNENGVLEECSSPNTVSHTISANDAIREALSLYESLGELRKQEAAYAYYQLACYQRDCCLRFLESDDMKSNLGKGESSVVQRMKQYSSLAERNWKKSMDFYGPKTHPVMFLTILLDRSALSFSLSGLLHSNTLLESALTCLLEGRDVSENTPLLDKNPEVSTEFWSQLQKLLKTMLAMACSTKATKPAMNPQHASSNKYADAKKLSELYKISLKSSDFSQLHIMHSLWRS